MSADPGTMLGKYQLIAELARGGMAIVYLAMVQGPGGFNKLVVIKELKPELIEEPTFLAMFLDEARLAARLNHPNIVQTNEVGSDGNRYFMAMDYLDGRGLDHVRRRARSAGHELSLPIHLRVLCDMLAGLHYAHTRTDFDGTPLAIVHRDVSPQNVFVTFDGQIKLLDFGIAKAADSLHETRVGILKGKVSYMSPEQARGQRVDARADVFSAGVMLWEALTGRRLREGQNDQQMLWALASADLPRASTVKPWVPPELDAICTRAMAFDREQRYPTAGELQHEIEHYLAVTGTSVAGREVGLCVSELFREDRERINTLIESHVSRTRDAAPQALPVIDVSSSRGTPSFERELSPERRRSDQVAVPRMSVTMDGQSTQYDSAPIAEPSRSREVSRVLRRRRVPIIAGVALAAIAAGAMVFIGRSGDDLATAGPRVHAEPLSSAPAPVPSPSVPVPPAPVPPSSPPASSPSASSPSASSGSGHPALIVVKIRVSPDSAAIAIDGAEVTGNPFTGKYVADGAIHQVRATAPGCVPRLVGVEFASNVALDLNLERIPPRPTGGVRPVPEAHPRPVPPARTPEPVRTAEPASAAPRPEAATAAAAASEPRPQADPDELNPKGGSQPRRPIDPNDPYGGDP